MASTFAFTTYDYVVTGDVMSGVSVVVEPRVTEVVVSVGPISIGTAYATQNGVGAPSGVVTPEFKGQIYFDDSTGVFYVSNGIMNTSWIEVVRNY